MWSRGIRTWSSWRNPLSIPKLPNLGPISPTLTPVGIETYSQLYKQEISLNFNLLSCAMVINGEAILDPLSSPPQFVTWEGCVVFKAPDLHDERVYPTIYSLCYQTCQHHGMGGCVPHCGMCKSLLNYANHLPEGLQRKIRKLVHQRITYLGEVITSLVPRPCTPPGEKRSGERSQISWAYSPKVVRTNGDCEIGNYYVALPLQQFISTPVSVPVLSGFGVKCC